MIDYNRIILSKTDDKNPEILFKNWMKRQTKDYLRRKIFNYTEKLAMGIKINDFKVRT